MNENRIEYILNKIALQLLGNCEDNTINESMKLKIETYFSIIRNKLKNVYGIEFIQKIKENSNRPSKKIFSQDKSIMDLPPNEILNIILQSLDEFINFLYTFNLKYKCVKEFIPYLLEENEINELSSQIIEQYSPHPFSQGIVMLAAGSKDINNKKGYILKEWEFQGYSFSIYYNGKENYTFEVLANCGSLKNKTICFTIREKDKKDIIFKEKCKIDTKQFSLFYSGKIVESMNIIPFISE